MIFDPATNATATKRIRHKMWSPRASRSSINSSRFGLSLKERTWSSVKSAASTVINNLATKSWAIGYHFSLIVFSTFKLAITNSFGCATWVSKPIVLIAFPHVAHLSVSGINWAVSTLPPKAAKLIVLPRSKRRRAKSEVIVYQGVSPSNIKQNCNLIVAYILLYTLQH